MATQTTAKKSLPSKATKAPTAIKPVSEALTKPALIARIAEHTALEAKHVKAVLASLEALALASLHKKGIGEFTLPGLFKATAVKVPAKKKRRGINPFTGQEQEFAAKPATVKVKVRPLKKIKDAVL